MEYIEFSCEQGTAEWFECRMGCVSASEMDSVMARGRGGEPSKTRAQYMRKLAAEIISGNPCSVFEGNADTRRGHELEPVARNLYEIQTGNHTRQIGFIKRGRVGCSPDALVGEDGGAEIKCKRPDIHIEVLLTGEVPSEHLKQIQTCLYVTGRKWWDFVCYTPGLPLFVKRVERDEELISAITDAANQFNADLDGMVSQVRALF